MSAPQNPAPTPTPPPAENNGAVPAVPPLPVVATPATGTGPRPTPGKHQVLPTEAPPTTPPADLTEAANIAAQDEEVKKAKNAYAKARFLNLFGKLRRHVAFFIVCGLSLFFNFWTFARSWQQERAGENENWFHEGLLVVVTVLMIILFYYRLYRKSTIYQTALKKREAAEKAAREARLKLEEEQKKQAFMGLIKDFQSANTYEQKGVTMAKLLTVGLESNLLRQQAIDLLCDLNSWMDESKAFLRNQNLLAWRLKGSLFEQSERFQVDSATQDLSIKSINIIEAIVKKHLSEFSSERTKAELDLSHKALPTLTLTAQKIPAGAIKFEGSNLWQASFSETQLSGLSFVECDLQAASFWRAQLENIDFKDANLQFSKLRTNLQSVDNLTAQQFFGSKEWELCYLSDEQEERLFQDTEFLPPGAKSNWASAEPRRRKLYFHLLRQQADSIE